MARLVIWTFLVVQLPLLLRADDDAATWSKSVAGLKARLLLLPLNKGAGNHKHFTLFFQLQHESNGWGDIEVDYQPKKLTVTVVDQDGKVIPWESVGGNRFGFPKGPLVLPQNAFMSFPIGDTVWQGSGIYLGEYLAFYDNFEEWMIPPHASMRYYLTGEFEVPVIPRDCSNPNFVWGGKLILSKVEIPRLP